MAGINFIRRWVMGQMKKTADDGIMITLPDSNKVDLNVSITMDRLIRNGINPDQITSPQQVDNAINMINSRMANRAIPADSAEGREITEKIFGKQKASVFDMEGNRIPEGSGIMGGKSLKNLMESGQVTKGARGMDKSKKVQDREMFQAANERLTSDVDNIIKNIKSMEPITAMKEANSVIGRKGKYKNLTPEESKKILQDTEDHIFERDIPEEDFASGGRAGLRFGGDTMGGKNDRSKSSSGPDRSRVSDRQQANHDRAMSDRSNDGPSFRDKVRSVVTNPVVQTLGGALLTGGINLAVPGALDKLNKARMIKNAIDYAKYIAPDKAIEDELENIQTIGGISPSMASGGIAGMLGERPRYQTGGDVAFDASDASIFGSNAITVTPETVADAFGNQVQQDMGNTYNPPLIEDVIEEKSVIEDTNKQGIMQNENIAGNPNGVGVNDPSMYHDSGVMKRPGPAIPDGAPFLKDADGNRLPDGPNIPIRPMPMPDVGPPDPDAYLYQADGTKIYPNRPQPIDQMHMLSPDTPNSPFGNIMQATPSTGSGPSLTQTEIPFMGKGGIQAFPPGYFNNGRPGGARPTLRPDVNLSSAPLQAAADSGGGLAGMFGGGATVNPFVPSGITNLNQLPLSEAQPISEERMNSLNRSQIGNGFYDLNKNGLGSPLAQAAMANGGRAGFAGGGMGRRGFLKLLGSLGAGAAAIKTGILGLGGKQATKEVVKEVAQSAGSGTPPPYFFKLVEKIKNLGDDVTQTASTQERQKVTRYKDYELTEDVATGRQEIQRQKVKLDDDAADYYGNPLTEETYMSYSPGERIFQETADGRTKIIKTNPEYEEGTALLRSDREYAGEVVDESFKISDDVIEEAMSEAPSIRIKKASGGIARMLGE